MLTLFRKLSCLLFLGLFLGVVNAQEEPITKEFSDGVYELKDYQIRTITNVIGEEVTYMDSYWVKEDYTKYKTIFCKVPKNCKEVDIKSLEPSCIESPGETFVLISNDNQYYKQSKTLQKIHNQNWISNTPYNIQVAKLPDGEKYMRYNSTDWVKME